MLSIATGVTADAASRSTHPVGSNPVAEVGAAPSSQAEAAAAASAEALRSSAPEQTRPAQVAAPGASDHATNSSDVIDQPSSQSVSWSEVSRPRERRNVSWT